MSLANDTANVVLDFIYTKPQWYPEGRGRPFIQVACSRAGWLIFTVDAMDHTHEWKGERADVPFLRCVASKVNHALGMDEGL